MMEEGEEVISCNLFGAETASVVRKLRRMQKLTLEQAQGYYDDTLALVNNFYDCAGLQQEAFVESIRLDHSVYDMFYFVLARRTGATLYSCDRSFLQLCVDNGVNCIEWVDGF